MSRDSPLAKKDKKGFGLIFSTGTVDKTSDQTQSNFLLKSVTADIYPPAVIVRDNID